jgi:hypothetical protein
MFVGEVGIIARRSHIAEFIVKVAVVGVQFKMPFSNEESPMGEWPEDCLVVLSILHKKLELINILGGTVSDEFQR